MNPSGMTVSALVFIYIMGLSKGALSILFSSENPEVIRNDLVTAS